MSNAYYIGLAIVLILVLVYYFKYVRGTVSGPPPSNLLPPGPVPEHPTRLDLLQQPLAAQVANSGGPVNDGIVFQCTGHPEIYITQAGQKRWYPTWEIYQKYGVITPVAVPVGSRLCALPDGPKIA